MDNSKSSSHNSAPYTEVDSKDKQLAQDLSNKKEHNKMNRQKLRDLEQACGDLREKIAEVKRQGLVCESEYEEIINSRAWRYVSRASKAASKVQDRQKKSRN